MAYAPTNLNEENDDNPLELGVLRVTGFRQTDIVEKLRGILYWFYVGKKKVCWGCCGHEYES